MVINVILPLVSTPLLTRPLRGSSAFGEAEQLRAGARSPDYGG